MLEAQHSLECPLQQLFQLRSNTAPLPGVFGTGVAPYDVEGMDAVSLHQDFVELYRQRRGIAHLQANGLDVGVDVLVFVVPQERSVLFPDFLPLLSLTPKLDGGRLVVAFSF